MAARCRRGYASRHDCLGFLVNKDKFGPVSTCRNDAFVVIGFGEGGRYGNGLFSSENGGKPIFFLKYKRVA